MSAGREPHNSTTIDRLVWWKRPHAVYQRTTDGQWWIWRGRRGWLHVRSRDMIQKLKARFGEQAAAISNVVVGDQDA